MACGLYAPLRSAPPAGRLPIWQPLWQNTAVDLAVAVVHDGRQSAIAGGTGLVSGKLPGTAHPVRPQLSDPGGQCRLPGQLPGSDRGHRPQVFRGVASIQRPLRSGGRVVSTTAQPAIGAARACAASSLHGARREFREHRAVADPRCQRRHRLLHREAGALTRSDRSGRHQGADRSVTGLHRDDGTGRPGGAFRRVGVAARGVGHRQGTRCQCHPSAQPARQTALRCRRLLRIAGNAVRERPVWPRARCFHRRHDTNDRLARGGIGRHALSRRTGRHPAFDPGQAVAPAGNRHLSPGGFPGTAQVRSPGRLRHPSPTGRNGGRGAFPAGSVLPPQHLPDPPAAVAAAR